jgi:hypothetical protein
MSIAASLPVLSALRFWQQRNRLLSELLPLIKFETEPGMKGETLLLEEYGECKGTFTY